MSGRVLLGGIDCADAFLNPSKLPEARNGVLPALASVRNSRENLGARPPEIEEARR